MNGSSGLRIFKHRHYLFFYSLLTGSNTIATQTKKIQLIFRSSHARILIVYIFNSVPRQLLIEHDLTPRINRTVLDYGGGGAGSYWVVLVVGCDLITEI